MVGKKYWAIGIVLRENGQGEWTAYLDFYDAGFCQDESTEGKLRTRYYVSLEMAIDTLIADAAKLGIDLYRGRPFLYYENDGESSDWIPPDGWRKTLQAQAARIGWQTYADLKNETADVLPKGER